MARAGHEHLVFEVLTIAGHAAPVEIRVHPLVVEIWRGESRQAVFNRQELRTWISDPQSPIRVNDVTFSLDRANSRITITMPDVPAWHLSPQVSHAFDIHI